MSKAQHTPGPWTIAPSGRHISADFPHTDPNSGLHCSIGRGIAMVERDQDTDYANARLIAAAPELLEYAELEEARTLPNDKATVILEAHGWNHSEMSAIEFMDMKRRAAIAKAKGE